VLPVTKSDEFGEDISQDEPTFRLVDEPGSDTLMISFAVFPRAGGKSAFDFVRATTPIPIKKLFLRDSHQMWYQKGTPGVGDSVPEVAEFVRQIVLREKVKRVIMIGNSGGAYSAILFGAMIGADEVQAFGPPTRLLEEDDTSFPEQLAVLKEERGLTSPFLDLRKVLEQYLKPQTRIVIHYPRGDKRDRIHAGLLRRFPNVRLIEYPMVTHHLARFYTRHHWLTPLLQAAAERDDAAFNKLVSKVRLRTAALYPFAWAGWFAGKVWRKTYRIVRGAAH
jgi:hypothetical protein